MLQPAVQRVELKNEMQSIQLPEGRKRATCSLKLQGRRSVAEQPSVPGKSRDTGNCTCRKVVARTSGCTATTSSSELVATVATSP